MRNSDTVKCGTLQERQTPLKVFFDRRGPRNSEKLLEKRIQSNINDYTTKIKGDNKMKHRRREPCSGVSYSRSNISRGMQGRILKMPNFSALRIQLDNNQLDSQSELIIPAPSEATSAFQHVLPSAIRTPQNKRSSDRNRRSQSYYGSENSLPDFAITSPPESPVRAGHVENYQPTNIFVVETVQSASEQLPAKDITYPVTGNDSPPDPRVRPFCRSEDPDTRAGCHIYDCIRS